MPTTDKPGGAQKAGFIDALGTVLRPAGCALLAPCEALGASPSRSGMLGLVPRWLQLTLVVLTVAFGSCAGCMALGFASARYGATDVRAVCDFAAPGRPVVDVKRFADEHAVSGSDYPAKGGNPAFLLYRKGRTVCFVDHDGTVATKAKTSFAD